MLLVEDLPPNAYDLLKPKEVMVIDAAKELDYLTNNYPDILQENAPGVYHIGQMNPVLPDGQYYFTKAGLLTNTPITDIDSVKEAVYNQHGVLLINDFTMRHKQALLTNVSKVSKAGIRAVYCFISLVIGEYSAYDRSNRYLEQYYLCFKPEFRDEIRQQNIDVDLMFMKLKDRLMKFIEEEPWTIFFVRQIGSMIVVEKTIDFRIFDWTLKVEDGAIEPP